MENVTQATAASILRSTLVRLEAEEKVGEVILHTHDEILMEVPEDEARPAVDRLVKTMTDGFPWSEGLPLAAEEAISWYYTKQP